jgi:hypothetical protein
MKSQFTLLFLSIAMFIVGCSPDQAEFVNNDIEANSLFETPGGGIVTIDPGTQGTSGPTEYQTELIAGQNIEIGLLDVFISDGNVTVVYSTDGDWVIDATHLYIGDLADLPTTQNGSPQIGQFPYSGIHNIYTTFVTYVGPALGEGECVYIAAHAEATNMVTGQNETVWAAGNPLGGFTPNSWAMGFEYCY